MEWAEIETNSLPEQARVMWRMVEAETGDPRHRTLLAELYKRTRIPPRDPAALARAVQRFAQTHINYLREQPETYAMPSRTLAWQAGDCDDQAMVVCTLLRGARVPCRLVFVGTDKGRGGPIPPQHVYTEAELKPGEWTALETVRQVPAGWSALQAWARKGWRTGVYRHGDASQMKGVEAG